MEFAVENDLTATVFNVQKFTVHDGPGIRTEFFLKGCPLRCRWCSNPESILPFSQVGVYPKFCIGVDVCGWCIEACPQMKKGIRTLYVADGKIATIDREKCLHCCACAKACPNDSLKIFGQKMTVSEALKIIEEDRTFYGTSGGGVTFSGGDPLVQWQWVLEVLKWCRHLGINTCVESELLCKTEILEEILPYTDWLYTDIKHMDSAVHRKYTGAGNEQILKNIRYAGMKSAQMVIRIPVIPGINDSEENLKATADFIRLEVGGSVRQLQLLPFRLLGTDKYEALGIPYPMADVDPPNPDEYLKNVRKIAEKLRSYGVPAMAGTTNRLT
ncbi:glycyl-radical enzyme activating protein [Caproiciproducens sp.]